MRIIGEIEHPIYKVTLFQHDQRLSIKCEDMDLEQTYKFRMGPGLDNASDLKALADDAFFEEVALHFKGLKRTAISMRKRGQQRSGEQEFPEII